VLVLVAADRLPRLARVLVAGAAVMLNRLLLSCLGEPPISLLVLVVLVVLAVPTPNRVLMAVTPHGIALTYSRQVVAVAILLALAVLVQLWVIPLVIFGTLVVTVPMATAQRRRAAAARQQARPRMETMQSAQLVG
jgi:hypothetical protein